MRRSRRTRPSHKSPAGSCRLPLEPLSRTTRDGRQDTSKAGQPIVSLCSNAEHTTDTRVFSRVWIIDYCYSLPRMISLHYILVHVQSTRTRAVHKCIGMILVIQLCLVCGLAVGGWKIECLRLRTRCQLLRVPASGQQASRASRKAVPARGSVRLNAFDFASVNSVGAALCATIARRQLQLRLHGALPATSPINSTQITQQQEMKASSSSGA